MALHQLISVGDKRSLTVVLSDGQVTTLTDDHPGFDKIVDALDNGASDSTIRPMLDPANAIYGAVSKVSERVSLVGGTLLFDGDPVDGPLADFIVKIAQVSGNTSSYGAWAMFMEKVATNPSQESRDHLFAFMTTNGLTVDTEGDIILYKGVRSDGKSIHAGPGIVNGEHINGNLPNEVGSILEFPRSKVDPNRGVACSTGLHAGTYAYASAFAQGRLLTVAVNPRDVVSVPSDHSDAKVRVSRYRVVEITEQEHTEPVWGAFDDEDEDDPFDDDGDFIEDDFDDEDDDSDLLDFVTGESDEDEDEDDEADEQDAAVSEFEAKVQDFLTVIPSIIKNGWDKSLALYASKKITAANRDAFREAARRTGIR